METRSWEFTEEPLAWFGREIEAGRYPCVDVGGVIVPGGDTHAITSPGQGDSNHGSKQKTTCRKVGGKGQIEEEGGEACGTSGQECSRPYSFLYLKQCLEKFSFDNVIEELCNFYPGTRIVHNSSAFSGIVVPVEVLRGDPRRAEVVIELPHRPIEHVRSWALRVHATGRRTLIRSHHQNPDGTMCMHSEGEWFYGVEPMLDYMSFCVFWIAKTWYEKRFGYYPGRQHCPDTMRRTRGRLDELCGCGSALRYRDCHWVEDQALTPEVCKAIRREEIRTRRRYLRSLREVGRAVWVPGWVSG